MDLSGTQVWQQACGDTNRDYSETCLKWDVILNGPGDVGPWPGCAETLSTRPRKLTDIRRFSEVMKDGDIVVLRLGTSKVCGVGQVVGNYEWRDDFGDIDGWDLQHVRRVRWLWRGDDAPQFDTYALKQGDTTQALNTGAVKDWLAGLDVSDDQMHRPIATLPKTSVSQEVSLNEISEHLFDKGVASSSISSLLNEMDELERIAKWYSRSKEPPSEHETVAYLAVPLLRALGWTPQKMAIEWNRVDVALFEALPRTDASLQIVVEAKRMGLSCLSAYSQAADYSKGKSACHRLIVTDGLRYGIYVRRDGLSPFRLHAYMNLTRLKLDYPILGCGGVKDALEAMAPEWKHSEL